MKRILMIAALVALGTPSVAQSPDMVLKARQGQFNLIALNLGVLGNMARGRMEYDAGAAQTAADTLAAIAMIDQSLLWPEGTDNVTLEGQTRALPVIFTDRDGFAAAWQRYVDGAATMQAAASNGQEALGPALGAIGGSCGNCHDTYRGPEN